MNILDALQETYEGELFGEIDIETQKSFVKRVALVGGCCSGYVVLVTTFELFNQYTDLIIRKLASPAIEICSFLLEVFIIVKVLQFLYCLLIKKDSRPIKRRECLKERIVK